MNINLKELWKVSLGILGMMIITGIIISIYSYFHNKNVDERFAEDNAVEEVIQLQTNNKIDSAKYERMNIFSRMGALEGTVLQQKKDYDLLERNYINTKQQLENFKNEKDHIPNVGSDEQRDYLSNYRHKEY